MRRCGPSCARAGSRSAKFRWSCTAQTLLRSASFFEGADAAGCMLYHKERNHWGCAGYVCVEYALIHVGEARAVFDSAYCGEGL